MEFEPKPLPNLNPKTLNRSMMIYGGTNGDEIFEDIWVFRSELKISSGRWFKVDVDHTRSLV
jgi:hypothetical protein